MPDLIFVLQSTSIKPFISFYFYYSYNQETQYVEPLSSIPEDKFGHSKNISKPVAFYILFI